MTTRRVMSKVAVLASVALALAATPAVAEWTPPAPDAPTPVYRDTLPGWDHPPSGARIAPATLPPVVPQPPSRPAGSSFSEKRFGKGKTICSLTGTLTKTSFMGRTQSVDGRVGMICRGVVAGISISVRIDARRAGRWVPLMHTSRKAHRPGPIRTAYVSARHLCRIGTPRRTTYRIRMTGKFVDYQRRGGSRVRISRGKRIRCNV